MATAHLYGFPGERGIRGRPEPPVYGNEHIFDRRHTADPSKVPVARYDAEQPKLSGQEASALHLISHSAFRRHKRDNKRLRRQLEKLAIGIWIRDNHHHAQAYRIHRRKTMRAFHVVRTGAAQKLLTSDDRAITVRTSDNDQRFAQRTPSKAAVGTSTTTSMDSATKEGVYLDTSSGRPAAGSSTLATSPFMIHSPRIKAERSHERDAVPPPEVVGIADAAPAARPNRCTMM